MIFFVFVFFIQTTVLLSSTFAETCPNGGEAEGGAKQFENQEENYGGGGGVRANRSIPCLSYEETGKNIGCFPQFGMCHFGLSSEQTLISFLIPFRAINFNKLT